MFMILYVYNGQIKTTINNPTIEDIKKALHELYISKNYNERKIVLFDYEISDFALEIYLNSVVLRRDFLFFDGPGGPEEIFHARINANDIFMNVEKIISLLDDCEENKLISCLELLPVVKEKK
jgi:hypothetical protein